MNAPFRGKVVWITGASSGIGRALALAFGRAGARLILSARNTEQLEAVARESGADARVIPLDLTRLTELPDAAARAVEAFGGVDIMVHNAGVAVRDRAANLGLEVHERVLRTNYLGPVVLTQALLPSMVERGGGRFVVVSSLSGKYGGPMLAAYAASKHALHGYFDTLRGEEREHGIGVTMVIPGFVRTDITAHALTGSGERFGRVLPIYREAMTPEDCAVRILRAVARDRREVLVGGPEVWTVYLQRLSPRLAARVIWGHPVKRRNRLVALGRELRRRLASAIRLRAVVRPVILLALLPAVLTPAGCAPTRVQRTIVAPSAATTLDRRSAYLKAHLRTGYAYVLNAWTVDSAGTVVAGRGVLLTPNRTVEREGEFRLPVDSVALFETNVLQRSGAIAPLAVMTGITAAVTVVCIANPKTCFGSCPTFYVSDSAGPRLDAEGFSASIAPALEATDVDALYRARPADRNFRLHLRNEALETHVIRFANLLAVRRPPGARVYLTWNGEYRAATELRPAATCSAAEGDCRAAVAEFDGRERTSLADSVDLATRESVDLEFDAPPSGGDLGLVISARQSLMSTYLLYQTYAYLGTHAPEALAALSGGGPEVRARADGMGRLLGRIEVLVPGAHGDWVSVGRMGETGPLAADTKLVQLPPARGPRVRVRLGLTRGMWRIDHVALARVGEALEPVRLAPTRVERDGRNAPEARRALMDSAAALVTLPGDAFDLVYRLPARPQTYELFLESRGYYLEWMRREWLAEENPAAAMQILLDPAAALRTLAPAFKRAEPDLERRFWNSRYVRR